MWSRYVSLVSFFPFLFLVFSCKKDNTSGVPAYVKIDSMVVITDYLKEGSGSANISDAWVFANDDELGAYELPNEIPVLASGDVNLKIVGGIKKSGVSSLRTTYPFYEIFETDTQLTETEITTVLPKLRYRSSTNFPWIEDFDDLTISLDTTGTSKANFRRITNPDTVREGKGSLQVKLNSELNYFYAVASKNVSLPNNGDPVYLEMDYYTNLRVQLYVRCFLTNGSNIRYPVVQARPKRDENGNVIWNKLYAYLSPYVSRNIDSYEYRLEFESWVESYESDGQMMLDNLKLVY